jgi:hypothetical protein
MIANCSPLTTFRTVVTTARMVANPRTVTAAGMLTRSRMAVATAGMVTRSGPVATTARPFTTSRPFTTARPFTIARPFRGFRSIAANHRAFANAGMIHRMLRKSAQGQPSTSGNARDEREHNKALCIRTVIHISSPLS